MVEADTGLAPRHLDQLRRSCADVVVPGDAEYDDARRLWNAIHDRRPAVIARPHDAQEVGAAIAFGREHQLEIAVQSGGHAASGLAGPDGSLVINLANMRGVEVDPATRTARANGGALLGELDVATQAHGLVCPVGVIGHTGVAGLTLGGGIGRLRGRCGLPIDNLTAVELVTADGRIVRATETEEPELFWGLRGAGWNFGIATALEFRLQSFGPDLHRGVLTYPAGQVHEVWGRFRDFAASAPDDFGLIFGINRAGEGEGYPDDVVGRPVVFIAWNHSGSADDVERDSAPLLAGPRRLTETIGSQSYLDVQTAHDLTLGWGSRSYIKSQNSRDIRAEALDEIVERVERAPSGAAFSATVRGGAIGRVQEDATAFAGRAEPFDVSADSDWQRAADDEANIGWCRQVMAILEPDHTLGGYSNGNSDAGAEESRRIYGDATLARLAALKRSWDPDNVFHVNTNVAPAAD
jgi:FAD/FMN-containing dehydrogenase